MLLGLLSLFCCFVGFCVAFMLLRRPHATLVHRTIIKVVKIS